jgi:hypothetical protein
MQRLEAEEMKALDRLRRCFDNYAILNTTTAKGVVREKADEIEHELKERYIEMPLDKDGVPIHVGDEMVSCGRHRFRFIVSELDFTDAFVHAVGIVGGAKYFFKPSEIVHYHKNPIEDMLRNLVTKARQIDVDGSPMLKESDIRELSDKLQLKEE